MHALEYFFIYTLTHTRLTSCMPEHSFHTLQGPAEGIYKEKGSKFLSFAYPVSSEMDIKEKIETLRKIHFDARHHCFAWMLGADRSKFRSFDDGEPSHSAGGPILNQIRSRGVTNVLIVVVRYFGGVKLGVSGLISAYKMAAQDALNNAVIVEKVVAAIINLTFEYLATSEIMRAIKDFNLEIVAQEFGDRTTIKLSVHLQQMEKLLQRLELIKAKGNAVDWEIES